MKKLLLSALMCLTSAAFAGDAAKLTHLGFSADGVNYAFMESGIQDGSGMAYAQIRFLDLASNKYSASAISILQPESEMELENPRTLADIESEAMKKAAASLKKLKISSSIKGDVLVSRKLTDLDTRGIAKVNFSTSPIIAGLSSASYELILSTSKATPSAETACMFPEEAKKLKLEIVDKQTNTKRVLQEDKTLPVSRGCAQNYEIEDVVVMQPDQMSEMAAKVVVLIRVFKDGFEGHDVRYMAVSGSLVK